MSQLEKQTITIQILLDISKSKVNQRMKFRQSIEYGMKNNILESYTQNAVR